MTLSRLLCHLLALSPGLAVAAAAPVEAGRVILATGSVEAVTVSGSRRALSRRDVLQVGERLLTGPNAAAQIRTSDDGTIAIHADSEFEIREYEFDGHAGNPDRAIFYLHKGGMRSITGGIGEQADDVYRMESEYGVVTSKGTTYQCIIEQGLHCGVYDGSIEISNAGLGVTLGLGASYDYATVQTPSEQPMPLLQTPSALLTAQPNWTASPRQAAQPGSLLPRPNNAPRAPAGRTNPQLPNPQPIRVTPVRQ